MGIKVVIVPKHLQIRYVTSHSKKSRDCSSKANVPVFNKETLSFESNILFTETLFEITLVKFFTYLISEGEKDIDLLGKFNLITIHNLFYDHRERTESKRTQEPLPV